MHKLTLRTYLITYLLTTYSIKNDQNLSLHIPTVSYSPPNFNVFQLNIIPIFPSSGAT